MKIWADAYQCEDLDIDPKELQYFNAISTTTNEDYISCNNDDDAIEYYGDLEELKNMIEKMKSLNFYPSYIILKLENKDYDYRLLKGINYPILIDYGERYTGSSSQNERFNRDFKRFYDGY